jgi:hypothetical protein
MAGYSASTCDILTLYPLGVECFTIDAYTPFTTDGYVGLIITGGTSPYTTTWSNGTQSLFLNNVLILLFKIAGLLCVNIMYKICFIQFLTLALE